MASLHKTSNFIKPIVQGDQVLVIRSINGLVTSEIKPGKVSATYLDRNTIKIKVKDSDIISIDFYDKNEAALGLSLFQAALEQLKTTALLVDKAVADYVRQQIEIFVNKSKLAYHQVEPSTIWEINEHTMDKLPSIITFNEDGVQIEGLVERVDNANFKVKFNKPKAGWLYAN